MKKNLLIVALISSALLLFTQTEVYTNSANPPDDHAGSPPSNITCSKSGCHNTAPTQIGDGIVFITADSGTGPVTVDDNFVYRLGKTYDFTISTSGANRYGFQMTMLDNAVVSPGNWAVASVSSTTADIASAGNKTFFEHKNATNNSSWTLEWTAPNTDPGPIGIYAVCNLANGNGNQNGDTIYKVSYTINAILDTMDTIPSGIYNPNIDPFEMEVYPNPIVGSHLNLVYTNLTNDILEIKMYNSEGRVVHYIPGDVANGRIHKMINLNGALSPGIYFLEVNSEAASSYKKVVVN